MNDPGTSLYSAVHITTFGYGHPLPPPTAHITLDLRHHFRDPHRDPAMRYLTAEDERVRAKVLSTSGIRELIDATADMVAAYLAGPSAGPVTIAVGCAGGRHRAAVVGAHLADILTARGVPVTVTHRDIGKGVIAR